MTPKPQVYVTFHALQRYQIHHPRARQDEVLDAILQGEEVPPKFAQSVTQQPHADLYAQFIVAPDLRGMFVINGKGAIVTYLRFQESQQKVLTERAERRTKKNTKASARQDRLYLSRLERQYGRKP